MKHGLFFPARRTRRALAAALAALVLAAVQNPLSANDDPAIQIRLPGEVDWQPLNPARGDASPRAGTLWGDRNDTVPTGFLARFAEGFSSPPHIHNVTYRAIVIEGAIHNDDPGAASQWMGPGSFWIQPAGETHITAAQAPANLALVEIDHGPYLVRSPEQAFDDAQRPLNVDRSNLVWSSLGGEAEIARLWGDFTSPGHRGALLRLPAGSRGTLLGGEGLHGVVIQGSLVHAARPDASLIPGSYLGSRERATHALTVGASAEALIYLRSDGPFHWQSAL